MRSGPGAARTILLFHIISARPSKQPRMLRTFLKVYIELVSYFLFLQEQIKDIIIIIYIYSSSIESTPVSFSIFFILNQKKTPEWGKTLLRSCSTS